MKFIYILLSCCAFSLNKGLITSKKTEMNWYEAQENCRQKGGILPDSDDITNSLRWAGKYRRISLLIKILGCYNDSFVQSTIPTNAYKMKTPSAGYCQEICLSFDSFVFAIKDNECRCLEEIPQKGNASTSLCNDTSCERDEEPYFDDCGGKETYSVFQSDPKNEKATDVNTSGCLAVQCSVPPNFTFYYEEDCSLLYKPFCDMTVSNTSATWMESMRICRSTLSLPVLTEEIFLHDINKTCKAIGENRTERYWLGVAKEKYIGFDKGK
ncbi:uncharacterized protein LOC134246594 [Saccostrea cucullata]|uniref:uncharacterized protein LOC134246594 n=1 Tax=Saccostrea cuccullata TaxID=36930 RepID=UPI002ED65C56